MYNPTKPYKHEILSLIKGTWKTPYIHVVADVYPILRKKFSWLEVQHTDGIGSKGIYHWRKRTLKNAVLDALAMNLNDLALVGATPYALQNHIILPKDDHGAILSIVRALTHECKKRKIAMTGGETSIHSDAKGMDISVTVSGFIKQKRENRFRVGDVLVGFKSNGLHSNGFTKVREVFGNQIRPEFTQPTPVYLDTILSLLKKYNIHGMMHITGGAFTKLKDLLGKSDALISNTHKLKPQKIFLEMHKRGLSSKTMYKTFNCGMGFVISTPPKDAKQIIRRVSQTAIIGEIVKGRGNVRIKSSFDGSVVIL